MGKMKKKNERRQNSSGEREMKLDEILHWLLNEAFQIMDGKQHTHRPVTLLPVLFKFFFTILNDWKVRKFLERVKVIKNTIFFSFYFQTIDNLFMVSHPDVSIFLPHSAFILLLLRVIVPVGVSTSAGKCGKNI